MEPIKPGWQTTEFWVTTVATVLSFLVVIGVVGQVDADTIAANIPKIMSGIVAAVSVVSYIIGRLQLKKEVAKLDSALRNQEGR